MYGGDAYFMGGEMHNVSEAKVVNPLIDPPSKNLRSLCRASTRSEVGRPKRAAEGESNAMGLGGTCDLSTGLPLLRCTVPRLVLFQLGLIIPPRAWALPRAALYSTFNHGFYHAQTAK